MKTAMLAVGVVLAAGALAGVALAQNESRGVTKTEIVLGMHTDLSGPAATYGVSSSNAVKMRFDGIQMQADKLKIKVAETTTHKPTDQDFTAQITRLKAAGCDLVVLGTIVRDSIVPYATARKIGWTDVDFLGSAASYDLFVAAAQGGVTEGLYAMRLTDMPYRDTLGPAAQARVDRYKDRFNAEPNI